MDLNGHSFLERVFKIVDDERAESAPLIKFKHPDELQSLLDLDVKKGTNDADLERCVRQVLRYSVQTGKATFRNQLDGATDPYGLSGAWIAEAFNTSQYTYEVAPVFTLIELTMLRHILELFGLPQGDGIFSPGGSISLFYAITTARYKAYPLVKSQGLRNLPEMVLFTSEDSHYSIKKAAHWLGFGTESIIIITTNDQGQMLVPELEAAIKREQGAGRRALLVNATAGTTVFGAIDDLEAISKICKQYDVWMHVDACWGGSLILSQNHSNKLNGIQSADSISWNPHKMPGAPLYCSVFLVRERGLLHDCNCAAAQYLFQQDKFYDVRLDTGDKSVQCGRKIDAFKLWMMWKARGDLGLSNLTDRTMEIAAWCLGQVSSTEGFRPLTATLQCPNVCFWYIPTFMRGKKEDEKWWELMHKITPKIKELLTLSSRLLVGYAPVRQYKNFFRLVFTFHPEIDEAQVLGMLRAIQECGEEVTMAMLK